MSRIDITKCDGPYCKNKINLDDYPHGYGMSEYHKLYLGGSDFEMSITGIDRDFDFCSLECIINFLKNLKGA